MRSLCYLQSARQFELFVQSPLLMFISVAIMVTSMPCDYRTKGDLPQNARHLATYFPSYGKREAFVVPLTV